MSLENLYQKIVLEHFRHPYNFEKLPHHSASALVENPLCGDSIEVMFVISEKNDLVSVKFQGHGCAISIASASMMTKIIEQKNLTQAKEIIEQVLGVLQQKKDVSLLDALGDISAIKGVIPYPARVQCASLAWQALQQGLMKIR